MFENKALRGIFARRRDEATEEWRKLHDLYSANTFRVIKSRRTRWAGHVARMGERRDVCRVLVGKPDGKRHFGKPDVDGRIIKEVGCGGVDRIELAQDRDRWRAIVNAVMNLRVP